MNSNQKQTMYVLKDKIAYSPWVVSDKLQDNDFINNIKRKHSNYNIFINMLGSIRIWMWDVGDKKWEQGI